MVARFSVFSGGVRVRICMYTRRRRDVQLLLLYKEGQMIQHTV